MPVVEEAMRKQFTDLIATVRRASKGRHTVAHGRWAIDNFLPDAVILQGRQGGLMSYKLEDFADILDRVAAAIAAIESFQRAWRESVQESLRKSQHQGVSAGALP